MLGPMSPNFSPYAKPTHACRHCHFFVRMLYENSAAECNQSDCSRVRSDPETGCSAFEREPGSDDDIGGVTPPAPISWRQLSANARIE